TVGCTSTHGIDAEPGLHSCDGAVGIHIPLLIGLTVAVPDDHRRAVGCAGTRRVQALVPIHHQLLARGVGEQLVRAGPAVVNLQLGAVGCALIGDVETPARSGTYDFVAATATGRAVADREVGAAAAAAKGLGREYLVVHRAEVHAVTGPRVEDVLRGDRPAGGVSLPDGQVLLEGAAVAGNAGLVDLLVLIEVVRGAIAGRGAHEGAQRGTAALVVLNDVVLDQRVGGPAVERRQRGAAAGAHAAAEADRLVAARVPADAGDEVADAAPGGGVLVAGGADGNAGRALAVVPHLPVHAVGGAGLGRTGCCLGDTG